MNYRLGGGGFASELTQQLREGKRLYLWYFLKLRREQRVPDRLRFLAASERMVTLEGAQLIKKILDEYPDNFAKNDLDTTQGFLIKSSARAFETSGAKLNMLNNISKYGWASDYIKDQETTIVKEMTVDEIKKLSEKYLDTDRMIWLVVGDAKTQLTRLKGLGFGDPVRLN